MAGVLDSPLRRSPSADVLGAPSDTAELANAIRVDPNASFERGLRSSASGLSAGAFADEALKAEQRGDREGFLRNKAIFESMQQEAQQFAPRVQRVEQINGLRDAGDYVAGALGQAVPTAIPSLAGGLAGGFVGGPTGAVIGASIPGYYMNRGEQIASQYQDPAIAALPAAQRDQEATRYGVMAGALDALVPGSVASRLLRPTLGNYVRNLGKEALVEGATEGAQTLLGQNTLARLNPNRDASDDRSELINSVLAGGIGGAGMSAASSAVTAAPRALLSGAGRTADAVGDAAGAVGGVLGSAADTASTAGRSLLDMFKSKPRAPIDLSASTAEVADQIKQGGANPISLDDLAAYGKDAADDAQQRVSGIFERRGEKPSMQFMVGDDDRDVARELVASNIDRSRLTKASESQFVEAMGTLLAAMKSPKGLTAEDLHDLGSSDLFLHTRNRVKMLEDVARAANLPTGALTEVRSAEADLEDRNSALYRTLMDNPRLQSGEERRAVATMIDMVANGSDVGRQRGRLQGEGREEQIYNALYQAFPTPALQNKLTQLLGQYSERRRAAMRASGQLVVNDPGENQQTAEIRNRFNDNPLGNDATRQEYDDPTRASISERTGADEFIFADDKVVRPFTSAANVRALKAQGRLGSRAAGNDRGVVRSSMLEHMNAHNARVSETGKGTLIDPEKEVVRVHKDLIEQNAIDQARLGKGGLTPTERGQLKRAIEGRDLLGQRIEEAIARPSLADKKTGAPSRKAWEAALELMPIYKRQSPDGEGALAQDEDLTGSRWAKAELKDTDDTRLTFRNATTRKTLNLNAIKLRNAWKQREVKGSVEDKTSAQFELDRFHDAVASVMGRGYTLARLSKTGTVLGKAQEDAIQNPGIQNIPASLNIGKFNGKMTTYGELVAAANEGKSKRQAPQAGPAQTALDRINYQHAKKHAKSENPPSIPAGRKIGEVAGKQMTYGELVAAAQAENDKSKADNKVRYNPLEAEIEDLRQARLDDTLRFGPVPDYKPLPETTRAERLQEIEDHAAQGPEERAEVLEGRDETLQAIRDRANVLRRKVSDLPYPQRQARREYIDKRRDELLAVYNQMFDNIRNLAQGDEREGPIDTNFQMGETLREQDAPGVRTVEPDTGESIQLVQDTARPGQVPTTKLTAATRPDFSNTRPDQREETGVAPAPTEKADRPSQLQVTAAAMKKKGVYTSEPMPLPDRGGNLNKRENDAKNRDLRLSTQAPLDLGLPAVSDKERADAARAREAEQARLAEDDARRNKEPTGEQLELGRARPPKQLPAAPVREKTAAPMPAKVEPRARPPREIGVTDFRGKEPGKAEIDAAMTATSSIRLDVPTVRAEEPYQTRIANYLKAKGWTETADNAGVFTAPRQKRSAGTTKFSLLQPQSPLVQPDLTADQQKELIDGLVKRLGKKVVVKIEKLAGGVSGSYANQREIAGLDGIQTVAADVVSIAINIGMDPARSVAAHEALHGLFNRLRGAGASSSKLSSAAILERVAMTPAVQKQLKALLAQYPAALNQIGQPEEAAAYMYQFWNAGQLKVVPPAAQDWMSKIRDMIRSVLKVATEQEKAAALMAAFDKGEFSNPATVDAVLRDLREKTFREKLQQGEVTRYLIDAADSLLLSSTDRLRGTNVPALRDLARKFHVETDNEGGRLGFLQRRAQQQNQMANRLNKLLVGKSETVKADALYALQTQQPATSKEAQELVDGLRGFLDSSHDYLTRMGVMTLSYKTSKDQYGNSVEVPGWDPLRKVKNYFPRVWDSERILANETEFRDLLTKYLLADGVTKLDVGVMVDGIVRSLVTEDTVGMNDNAAYTPFMEASNSRALTFINAKNAEQFQKFQAQDLSYIMSRYIFAAAHRGAYAKIFGNDGEVIREALDEAVKQGASAKDLDVAKRATSALLGTMGKDLDPKLRTLMNGIIAYENIVLLPFSLINNLMDAVGIAARSGDLKDSWEALKTGLAGVKAAIKGLPPGEKEKLAAEIGLIDDEVLAGSYGFSHEGHHVTGFAKSVQDRFFKLNGMYAWNKSMRIAAMTAGVNFIKQRAVAAGKGDETSIRMLRELNLSANDVKIKPDGSLALTVADGLTPQQANKMQEAMMRFVDGAAIRPNAAHRPIWGSDPRFMLIFHLKQFTYSFQNVVKRYVEKEAEHENYAPTAAMLAYVPVGLTLGLAKSVISGRPVDTTLSGMLALAVKNATLGTTTFTADVFTDLARNQVPGASFLGPSAGHAIQAAQTLAGSPNDSVADLGLRSAPLGPALRATLFRGA
jgi:hypothetical protein